MTIHLHTKHYQESGLSLYEYFMCLLYEQREDYSRDELVALLKSTDRTITRIRQNLVTLEYLQIVGRISTSRVVHYKLTNKLYKS